MIECRLCGGSYNAITPTHLKSWHDGMTMEEYRGRFPYASLNSEDTRDLKSSSHLGVPRKDFTWAHRIAISDARKRTSEGMTPEERYRAYRNSVGSDEANARCAEVTRTEEVRRRISEAKRGVPNSKSHCESMSRAMKEQWKDLGFAKKMSVKFKPNLSEYILGIILERNFPGEWRYTGSGDSLVVIGGKIPDFININGKKQIVEMFGNYYHPDPFEEEEKIAHYKDYGFSCLVIWEDELGDEELIVKKLRLLR